MTSPSLPLAAHIFRKDLRHTRILLSVWAVLIVLQFALVQIGADPGDHVMQAVFTMISFLVPMLQMLLLIVIIPIVIQSEPLVGTTAFWFTRPISPATLLGAKGFYAALLVLTPFIIEILVMAAHGATARDLALATPEILMGGLSSLLSIAVLAVLTVNFGFFAIASVVLFVGIMLITSAITISRLLLNPEFSMEQMQQFSLIKSRSIIASLFTIAVAGTVVAHQYFTRRTAVSIIVAIAGFVLATVVQSFWPWDFMKAPVVLSRPPFDVQSLQVSLGRVSSRDVASFRGGSGKPRQNISADVIIQGVPSSFVIHVEKVSASLSAPGGAAIRTFPARAFSFDQPVIPAVSAALDNVPVLNASSFGQINASLFAISASDYSLYANQPLRFSGSLDFRILRYDVDGRIPAARGAALRHGSERITVTDVLKQPDGVDILLQQTRLNLLFDRSRSGMPPIPGLDQQRIVYALVNRTRNEAIIARPDFSYDLGAAFNQARRLVNSPLRLDFKRESQSDFLFPVVNDEWLAGAELVRLALRPVADFSRDISIPDFRLEGGRSASPKSEPRLANPDQLAKIVLPDNPTDEQVAGYVRAIIIASRDQTSFRSSDPQVEMLKKVGSGHLDILIAASGGRASSYVDKAIDALVREEDKQLILQNLAAHRDLARVVVKNGWEQDARDTLVSTLQDDDKYLPSSWITAVVSLRDPSTYDALVAYFLRCNSKASTFASLSKLPDLDLGAAVTQAWTQAKTSKDYVLIDMLRPAMQYGHADAIASAVDILRKDGSSSYEKRRAREALLAFTPATGDEKTLITWYDAHGKQLVFDPAARKFILPASTP